METPPKASDCWRCSCKAFCVVFLVIFLYFHVYFKDKVEERDYSGLEQPQVTASLILLDALKTQSLEVGAR